MTQLFFDSHALIGHKGGRVPEVCGGWAIYFFSIGGLVGLR